MNANIPINPNILNRNIIIEEEPFYKKWWFYLILLILFIVVISLIYYFKFYKKSIPPVPTTPVPTTPVPTTPVPTTPVPTTPVPTTPVPTTPVPTTPVPTTPAPTTPAPTTPVPTTENKNEEEYEFVVKSSNKPIIIKTLYSENKNIKLTLKDDGNLVIIKNNNEVSDIASIYNYYSSSYGQGWARCIEDNEKLIMNSYDKKLQDDYEKLRIDEEENLLKNTELKRINYLRQQQAEIVILEDEYKEKEEEVKIEIEDNIKLGYTSNVVELNEKLNNLTLEKEKEINKLKESQRRDYLLKFETIVESPANKYENISKPTIPIYSPPPPPPRETLPGRSMNLSIYNNAMKYNLPFITKYSIVNEDYNSILRTDTNKICSYKLEFNPDGNLVITSDKNKNKNNNNIVWSLINNLKSIYIQNTKGPYKLALKNNGVLLCVDSEGKIYWELYPDFKPKNTLVKNLIKDNFCLSIVNASKDSFKRPIMFSCNITNSEQRFTLDDKNRLINTNSNKCLTQSYDVLSKYKFTEDKNTNSIWQEECRDNNNLEQQWKYNRHTGELVSSYNNKCLDIFKSSNINGADVVANPCNDSKSQKWFIDI